MKKSMALLFIILTSSLPLFANWLTCEQSQKNRLSDDLIKQLTVKVCPQTNSTDPDIYLEYFRKLESLSGSEFLVYEYTNICYQKINSELFKTKDLQDSETIKLAQQLDAVLCDYPQNNEVVFRGANLPEAAVTSYFKSKEISIPAFSSTSTSFDVACYFAKQGNTLMKIKSSKTGHAISKISSREDELEVLFRLNTKFRIVMAMTGFQASIVSGCKGISHYLELEEITSL